MIQWLTAQSLVIIAVGSAERQKDSLLTKVAVAVSSSVVVCQPG